MSEWKLCKDCEHEPVCGSPHTEHTLGCDYWKRCAVDAVEVVRCKDCKHSRELKEQEKEFLIDSVLICESGDACDECWNPVFPEHFCSYGKRKEGAD